MLGLLLFILDLNNFNVMLSCKCYTDDLLIYMHLKSRNLSEAINKVNDNIGIESWTIVNCLKLNFKKTTMILSFLDIQTAFILRRIYLLFLYTLYTPTMTLLNIWESLYLKLSWERQENNLKSLRSFLNSNCVGSYWHFFWDLDWYFRFSTIALSTNWCHRWTL